MTFTEILRDESRLADGLCSAPVLQTTNGTRYAIDRPLNIVHLYPPLLNAAARCRWPGNLRELENLVKRYVILDDVEETFRELLDLARFERRLPLEELSLDDGRDLKARVRDLKDETELEAILDALDKTRWCRKRAAERLGISYKALLYKMRRFRLDGGPGSRSAAVAAAGRGLSGGCR